MGLPFLSHHLDGPQCTFVPTTLRITDLYKCSDVHDEGIKMHPFPLGSLTELEYDITELVRCRGALNLDSWLGNEDCGNALL